MTLVLVFVSEWVAFSAADRYGGQFKRISRLARHGFDWFERDSTRMHQGLCSGFPHLDLLFGVDGVQPRFSGFWLRVAPSRLDVSVFPAQKGKTAVVLTMCIVMTIRVCLSAFANSTFIGCVVKWVEQCVVGEGVGIQVHEMIGDSNSIDYTIEKVQDLEDPS